MAVTVRIPAAACRRGDYATINAPLHRPSYTNKTDPASGYSIVEVWPARSFDPAKHMAWPIRSNEISLSNGAYKQTPGW